MRKSVADHLAPAPAPVRARMLAAKKLEPGAAAVVGRFFQIVSERGEPIASPSRASFDAAAKSESTLATLLRALETYAPHVGLAGGRDARAPWYAKRKKSGQPRRRGRAPLPQAAPASWPIEWALLYPRLRKASIEETSKRRYVDSINRLVANIPQGLQLDWSRYMAVSLFAVFSERDESPTTIGNYIEGLIALGRHGGLGCDKLAGLREMRAVAEGRSARMPKEKFERIAGLVERGGFVAIVEAIGDIRDQAETTSARSSSAQRLRRMAAVLAIEINAYGRTGDVSAWRLGSDLIREPWGAWRLAWDQSKTRSGQDLGELWLEVSEVLDELILAGRPRRYAALRYNELLGLNWLSLAEKRYAPRYPSELVSEAIGAPLHDLRTLIADFMREADPARAADLIAAILGHRSRDAGEEYRALCEGDLATREWQNVRQQFASGAALP